MGFTVVGFVLIWMFVVVNGNVFEQNECWFEIFCHLQDYGMSVTSPVGRMRVLRAYVVLICCQTLSSPAGMFTWKNNEVDWNYFAWNKYFWIWTRSKLFVCYKTQHICCARLWKVWERISKTRRSRFIGFSEPKNVCPVRHSGYCQCCPRVSAGMERCISYSVSFVCCREWKCVWTKCWFENFCHSRS